MSMSIKRLLQILSMISLALTFIWGCSSGGGGGNPPGPSGPTLSFQPDSSVPPSTRNFLDLSLNTAESSTNLVVLDLSATNLNTAAASGVSADLQFDSTQMDFMGFVKDTGGVGIGLAASLETSLNTIVMGVHNLKRSSGVLGKLKFRFKSGVQTGTIAFSPSLRYIGLSGDILPNSPLTARGGTIQIKN